MNEKELIDAYFNDPKVREFINEELGAYGKIEANYEDRTIKAIGPKATKEWDMDDFLSSFRRDIQ